MREWSIQNCPEFCPRGLYTALNEEIKTGKIGFVTSRFLQQYKLSTYTASKQFRQKMSPRIFYTYVLNTNKHLLDTLPSPFLPKKKWCKVECPLNPRSGAPKTEDSKISFVSMNDRNGISPKTNVGRYIQNFGFLQKLISWNPI